MTPKEQQEFAAILVKEMQASAPPVKTAESLFLNNKNLLDLLFKGLLGLLVWMGSGMKTDLEKVMTDVNQIKVERKYDQTEVAVFKEALKEPRYTREDHLLETKPLVNSVARNTAELQTRNPIITDNTNAIIALKYDTSKNAENISEILKILKAR